VCVCGVGGGGGVRVCARVCVCVCVCVGVGERRANSHDVGACSLCYQCPHLLPHSIPTH
jgi:hypothetical protein